MTKTFTRTLPTTVAAVLYFLCLATLAVAQSPYADPYSGRPAQRDARLAYLAAQRAKAAVPVNYTFPVRPDIATAYSAAAYSPQYQYSRYISRPYADRNVATHRAYPDANQTAYRPTAAPYTTSLATAYANPLAPNPYRIDASSCAANSATSYYRASPSPRGDASPYYVGASLAGPPKVYPKDEPVRNLFRYLVP
jgi:hypothetical protein